MIRRALAGLLARIADRLLHQPYGEHIVDEYVWPGRAQEDEPLSGWSTRTPDHVRERLAPLRGEDTALVRPYVTVQEDTLRLRVPEPELWRNTAPG